MLKYFDNKKEMVLKQLTNYSGYTNYLLLLSLVHLKSVVHSFPSQGWDE